MALTRTTLSAAVAATDTKVNLASLTSVAAGSYLRVDGENMQVTKAYASANPVPVTRGLDGSAVVAHASGAGVVHGAGSDFANPAAGAIVAFPIAGKSLLQASYSASGAITLPAAGSDLEVQINGTTICAMTVAAPTKDMDNSKMWISSNGAAAHTVTFSGGLSGAGASYDVITVNASAPVTLGPFVAINSLWQMPVNVPLAGTVTNVTATVA